ncbi:MAG: BTAD domain-containing putative transcriptional regulator [Acidimicrobiia bacterium]
MRFRVLGPLTVTEGTTALHIGGPKQRTVLAMLIAHADDPVSADSIIEAVWGEDAAPNARRIVQTYVATLRGELGDTIVKSGSGWRLDADRDAIDSSAFEDLYRPARDVVETNPQRASVALREALAMWRGHPYADVETHGALDGEISRLTELRSAAQATRIDADLALGRDADLVGEIEALMAENPYSERFRAQAMLALYRAGRQREALRSYQHMRSLLLEELGVDPTPELQELERRILDQDQSLRLAPTHTIQRRAILVADPGDPIEIGHMPAAEREDLLMRTTRALRNAIDREGHGHIITAGTTTYVVFDSVLAAANVAESVTRRLDGEAMRFAIDWGDTVLESGRVSGPPVSRAAVMAAVAHNGQTLLSTEAQQAVGNSGSGRGIRFENLGSYNLYGVEGSLVIYQLLVGDIPPVFPELETHRLPPRLPGGGDRSVPGYELREAIAPGALGTLYRAFQPSVGREVLIEVIGRGDSSDADFIRSFEADAQRLSLLDHQNIAPLIDYWRQPDGAFLVYRYPRGGLLSQGATVDVERLVDQIGLALRYAHSLGMMHGSVRPDRIALDEAGNASLLCFPVAGVAPEPSDEYRPYLAPEVARGEGATIASDIYSLAILARQFGASDPALDRATNSDPTRRPRTVTEFLSELDPAPAAASSDRFTETRNPYKGLTAFHESDAADYFGRSAATEDLCRALAGSSLLAIVGPSGIGKSSVARAGLVPALRSGRLPGSETWLVTDMLPGSHPFLELQRALARVSVDLPVALTEALAAQEPRALEHVAEVLPEHADLVVLVDQFEELFTMNAETERQAFLDLIETSVRERWVRFVLTVRADFLDRPLLYAGFGGLLKTSTVMLTSPTPGELAEAISRPARGVGLAIAPDLVERMVGEVRDQPGALPLLQHTLAELFASRRSDLIGIADFDEVGGVTGSLAKRAESIYSRLPEADGTKVNQLFLRLVTIVDESAPTRRRVRVTELADLEAEEPIEAFVRSRLLVLDADPETRTPTIEVAHEALLTHWPRLAGWIDSAREDLTMVRRLDESLHEWEASGRSDSYLLAGGRLLQHQAWTTTTTLALSRPEHEYLQESRRHDARLKTRSRRRRNFIMGAFAAAAAIAVVFALSASRNARQAESERLVASAALAAQTDPELALLLATWAFRESPSLAAQSALHQGIQSQRNLMTIDPPAGASGVSAAIDPDGQRVAVAGHFTSLIQMWEIGQAEPTWERRISDDSNAVVDRLASIWFSSDGERVYVPLGSALPSPGEDPADSPGLGLYEVDARSGETLRFLRFPCLFRVSPAGTNFVDGPLFAIDYWVTLPDGTCDQLGGASVLNMDSGETTFDLQLGPGVEPTVSSDGRFVAVTADIPTGGPYSSWSEIADDTTFFFGTRVYDTTTGEVVCEYETFAPAVISPDGQQLLADREPTYLYEMTTCERLQTYQGAFTRIRFVGEGSLVAGATPAPGEVRLFDAISGVELLSLRGHTEAVRTISLSEDGGTGVSSGFDGARVWDTNHASRGDLAPVEIPPQDGTPFYLDAISAGDDQLLTRRAGIRIVNFAEQPLPYRIDVIDRTDGAHLWGGEVWAAELAPNGIAFLQRVLDRGVASPSGVEDTIRIGRPEIVEARTGEHLTFLEGCEHYRIPGDDFESAQGCVHDVSFDFVNLQFSADGSTLSGATAFGEVVVWDVESGKIIRHDEEKLFGLRGRLTGYRWTAALSPDGSQIVVPPSEDDWNEFAATGKTPSVVVEDLATGREQGGFEVDQWIDYLTFVPQTGKLVGAYTDVLVIDPQSWEIVRMTRAQGAVITDLAVSPSGTLAATVSLDSHVVVWDLEAGRVVAEFPVLGHVGEGLRGVEFLDDETIVVAPEIGERLLRFTLDQDLLFHTAVNSLTRGFRPEECATHDIDPCPSLAEMGNGP